VEKRVSEEEHSKRFRGGWIRRVKDAIPLTSLEEGQKAKVVFTTGGYGLVRRLAEMGLTPGTEIKLLRKGLFSGPVEIEVRGVSLALGYGVASKVFVRLQNGEKQ
jgi:ferrous iron transport protein A